MSFLNLPTEIHEIILNHVPNVDLVAYALTHSFMLSICKPRLSHRNLDLSVAGTTPAEWLAFYANKSTLQRVPQRLIIGENWHERIDLCKEPLIAVLEKYGFNSCFIEMLEKDDFLPLYDRNDAFGHTKSEWYLLLLLRLLPDLRALCIRDASQMPMLCFYLKSLLHPVYPKPFAQDCFSNIQMLSLSRPTDEPAFVELANIIYVFPMLTTLAVQGFVLDLAHHIESTTPSSPPLLLRQLHVRDGYIRFSEEDKLFSLTPYLTSLTLGMAPGPDFLRLLASRVGDTLKSLEFDLCRKESPYSAPNFAKFLALERLSLHWCMLTGNRRCGGFRPLNDSLPLNLRTLRVSYFSYDESGWGRMPFNNLVLVDTRPGMGFQRLFHGFEGRRKFSQLHEIVFEVDARDFCRKVEVDVMLADLRTGLARAASPVYWKVREDTPDASSGLRVGFIWPQNKTKDQNEAFLRVDEESVILDDTNWLLSKWESIVRPIRYERWKGPHLLGEDKTRSLIPR